MPLGRAWRILAAAAVLQTGFSVADMGLPVMTGFIKSDLHLSTSGAGLIVAVYFGGKLFGTYPAGRAADRLGEARVLMVGTLATAAMDLVAVVLAYPFLLIALALAGFSAGCQTPAGGSLVRSAFPASRRGVALGIRQTGISVGGLLAAAILPPLAHAHGWRLSMAVAALVMMASTAALLCVRGVWSPAHRPRRAARPRRGVASRDIVLLTIWGTVAAIGMFSLLVFVPLDLHQRNRWSLAAAASFVVVLQAGGILGRVGWGWLSDRFIVYGRKVFLSVITLGAAGMALVLALVPGPLPTSLWVAVTLVGGVTLVGFQGLWVTMVTEAAQEDAIGAATGFAVTFLVAGGALAPPLLGALADATGTYRSIWAVLAGLLVLSCVPIAQLGRKTVPSCRQGSSAGG